MGFPCGLSRPASSPDEVAGKDRMIVDRAGGRQTLTLRFGGVPSAVAARRKMTRLRPCCQHEEVVSRRRKAGSDQDPIPPSPESGLYSVRPGSTEHRSEERRVGKEGVSQRSRG